MKKTVLLLALIICFSCKEKQKETNDDQEKISQEEIAKEKDDIFKVLLNVKALDDDKFELLYVDDSPDGNFNGKNKISKPVKASNDFQTIEFKLPKKSLPYKLRIDLGGNGIKNESNIEINNITLQLNGEKIVVDSTNLNSFFHHNIYLQKISNGYSRRIFKGKYDPFISSKPLLSEEIELKL